MEAGRSWRSCTARLASAYLASMGGRLASVGDKKPALSFASQMTLGYLDCSKPRFASAKREARTVPGAG